MGSAGRSGPTVLSLYSGAGGFDAGFWDAGFVPVLAADNNEDAAATHEALRERLGVPGCPFEVADAPEVIGRLGRGDTDAVIGGPPWALRHRSEHPLTLWGSIPADSAAGQRVSESAPPACEYHNVWFDSASIAPLVENRRRRLIRRKRR
jgi:hypothetical protein